MDFSDLCPDIGNDHLPSGSGCSLSDSFFAGVWEDTAEHRTCTHTHICVPPVDDPSHTHTCVHVHAHTTTVTTAAAATPPDAASPSAGSSRKLPSSGSGGTGTGNRTAVRKYREKKKAHAASLEQHVRQLTALNQQLTAQVAALQAEKLSREVELTRLRCLLVEFRGRIDREIGAALPYQIQIQRPVHNIIDQQEAFLGISNSCGFRCNDHMYCNPGPGMQGSSSAQVVLGQQGACDGANIQCIGSTNLPACGGMDTGPAGGCIPDVGKD
jgi:hypothetical protein